MKTRFVPLLTLITLLSACGDDNPARPTALQQARYLISGTVTEAVEAGVADYSLSVVDSERTQLIESKTPGYRVSVREGAVTLEFTKEGYRPKSVSIDVRGPGTLLQQDIQVEPVTPPAVFSGSLWMSLTADPAACGSLPAALRTRRYGVDVGQSGAALTVHLSDPKLTGQKTAGRILGNALSFELQAPDWYYGLGAATIEEHLDDSVSLTIVGSVTGTVSAAGAVGQLTGWWHLQDGFTRTGGCTGVHEVRLERR